MSHPGGLPILTYHSIDDSGSVIAAGRSRFADAMAALHERGFACEDLQTWIDKGRPSVPDRFALTFDDGLRSLLTIADILHRYSFRATVFVVAGRIGGTNAWPGQPAGIPVAPLLDRGELIDLVAAGFALGSHTMNHPDLSRCDDVTLEDELRRSRDVLEDLAGRPCSLLAYPYGRQDARVRRAARRHYAACFTARPGLARADQPIDRLPRVDAYDLRPPSALRDLLGGRLENRLRVRGALRSGRRAVMDLVRARP